VETPIGFFIGIFPLHPFPGVSMKSAIKLIVPILVLALAGFAHAAEKKPAEKKPAEKGKTEESGAAVTGMIVTVNRGDVTITMGENSKERAVVHTDTNTKVTVDGKESSVKGLHGGMQVSVKGANGVATTIDATTPKAKTTKKKA
jgi:hypothetical protein